MTVVYVVYEMLTTRADRIKAMFSCDIDTVYKYMHDNKYNYVEKRYVDGEIGEYVYAEIDSLFGSVNRIFNTFEETAEHVQYKEYSYIRKYKIFTEGC